MKLSNKVENTVEKIKKRLSSDDIIYHDIVIKNRKIK